MKKLLTFLCLLIPCNAFAVPDLPPGVDWVDKGDSFQYKDKVWSCNDSDATYELSNDHIVYIYIKGQPLKVIRCSAYDGWSYFKNDQFVNNLNYINVFCKDNDLVFPNPNGLQSTNIYTVSIKQNPQWSKFDYIYPKQSNYGIFVHGCVSIKCNENYTPDYDNNRCVPNQSIDETKTEEEIIEKLKNKSKSKKVATGSGVGFINGI
ncbi:MAG: hypothetical protein IKW67_03285 [Alphaproteobacteria bacterium]|nr:hypothetical protein [Alphaproteobacteria bacterium]